MCVSDEISTLSVQRFDRGSVLSVLNQVTEHVTPIHVERKTLGGHNTF